MDRVYKNKVIDFWLYLLIIVLPFELIFTPFTLLFLALTYILLGDRKGFLTRIKENKPIILIMFMFIINLIGMLLSSAYGISFNRVEIPFLLILIPILFIGINLNYKKIQKAKYVYIISCIAFCIFALITLIYNFIINFEHRLDYNFVQSSMYHFHYPYDVLCINCAYTLLLFNLNLKRYKGVVALLFLVIIVLSGVRMGIIIYAIISLIYFILNLRSFLNFKSLFVLIVFLIMSLILIKSSAYVNDKFFDSLNKIGFKTEKEVSKIGENYHNIKLRQILWSSAIKALDNSPNLFLGYGPKGSRDELNKIYNKEKNSGIDGYNSHNQYLTTLLNNGFVGLLLLFSIFITGLIQSIKIKSPENILIILIIAIAFITESMLERQKGMTIFTMFLTLIFLENSQIEKAITEPK